MSEPGDEHEAGSGFCDSVWKVESHTSDPVRETEATLVATVYNAGEVRYVWYSIDSRSVQSILNVGCWFCANVSLGIQVCVLAELT